MPAKNSSPIVSRIAELEQELREVRATLERIDLALANLQEEVKQTPELRDDAEYVDRMAIEGGRRRIMDRRREEIEAEIANLRKRAAP